MRELTIHCVILVSLIESSISFLPNGAIRKPLESIPVLHSTVGWEDIIYNAQSIASDLASLSIQEASIRSLPIMYGAGLLASISPCVWGLLPLTMSYISTAAGEREDKKATLPTLAFAAGLASVFCSFGLIAASMGTVFGKQDGATEVFVSFISSTICIAMGFQLLDFLTITFPSFNWGKSTPSFSSAPVKTEILLDSKGNLLTSTKDPSSKNTQGSLVRTFLLGGSSVLVSSPCATPVLTSILAFVANSHDPWLGATLLLGYTLGYSTPLLVVASTGGQFLANQAYGTIAPWITPLTGGVLLWYGTTGTLTAILGDPNMVGLAPIIR
jgi:cytochrome c-type biogenesis protein